MKQSVSFFAIAFLLVLSHDAEAHYLSTSLGAHNVGGFNVPWADYDFGEILATGAELGVQLIPDFNLTFSLVTTEIDAWFIAVGFRTWTDVAPFKWNFGIAAAYYERGNGVDLGLPLEFITSTELVIPTHGFYFGIGFRHLSNASFGSSNPGLNTLYLVLGAWTDDED